MTLKILILAALFFVTAFLYASVGFGGGSTYTALLSISGADYRLIPIIALTCNILVVSGNVWRYGRTGFIRLKSILPLVILSVPAAWLGGRMQISETVFIGLLWAALLFAGVRLLWTQDISKPRPPGRKISPLANPVIGGVIGFYAGLVGIGGGIFLAPVLHFLRWGSAKHIAAACSVFILVNSLSGIAGQATKLGSLSLLEEAYGYWPLIPAVIIGGLLGNFIGTTKLSDKLIKRVTGALILLVAIRLAWRWFGLIT